MAKSSSLQLHFFESHPLPPPAGELEGVDVAAQQFPLHPPSFSRPASTPNNYYRQTATGKLKLVVECSGELEHFTLHPPCSPSTPPNYYSLGKAMMIMASLMILIMSASVDAQSKINITILESAVPKGAVCLDGSAPAYSYAEGFGNGSTSWIVYLQGGGWCNSIEDCSSRALKRNGSSLYFPQNTTFSGLLESNDSYNPNFYNWHKVFIYYYDGASFMADVEHPVNNLTFRGARIFKVMIEEMLSKGMKNAKNAILTGSSAGGLATCLHCDSFGALFPPTTRVKCISDSGFFFHRVDRSDGKPDYFAQVIATHELMKSLPTSCTTKMDPTLCFNPENFIGDLKTPIFLLESAFDRIQISYDVVPPEEKPAWIECLQNISLCNSTELQIMRDFRAIFIEKLLKLDHSPSRGMFVHSYFRHGHFLQRGGWTCSFVYGNTLANKSIGEAVSDWYFDRSSFKMIDVQNDIPLRSLDDDTPFLNQQCLATLLQLKSIASHQIANKLLCILVQILITFLLY